MQDRFCQEYIIDLNGTQAYKRAGHNCNEYTARTNASKLLANTNVHARIEQLAKER